MGFAKARTTVEEERIAAGAGSLDDAFRGGNSDVVVAANDKVI